MNEKVKIILVEDVETDALLAVFEIRKVIEDIEMVTVDTKETFQEALFSFQPDLIVTDYSLPAFDGMTALKMALEFDPLIPVIIFTGSQNESIAVECIKSGAVDYVLKEQQRRLGQAVVNALKQKEVQIKKEEALAMLEESEQRNRFLYESMAQGVIYRDQQGKIIRMNNAAQSILGINHFNPDDKSADPLFHSFYENGTSVPREAYPAIKALHTGEENHITLLYYNREKDIRKWITHHSRPEFRKGEKKPFRVFSTMEDITEHKRLISEISQLNQLLSERVVSRTNEISRLSNLHSAILNNAGTAVIVFNHENQVELFNPAAERMFGYSASEVTGKPAPRLFSQVDTTDSADESGHDNLENGNPPCEIVDLLEKTQKSSENWVGIRNDGTALPVKLTVSTFKDETGSEAGMIAIVADNTAEEEYAHSLRISIEKEKELNELKSKIVRLTSHEFKTPLASILMASETLQQYGMKHVDDKFSKYFDRINKNVQFMKDMIDKFLNLSKLESGHLPVQLSRTDLVRFTRNWLDDYQEKHKNTHTFLFQTACDQCLIQVDPYLMEQVLNNVVSNGIKYSPEGSTLKIEIDTSVESANITITDEGIGIPAEEQKNIFTSFFRASNARKAAGTGLGLAMVKQIVELHGGKITITSEENKGTQVLVKLPKN